MHSPVWSTPCRWPGCWASDMFSSLHDLTEDIRLPREILHELHPTRVDPDGLHHHPHVQERHLEGTVPSQISLADITRDKECPCLRAVAQHDIAADEDVVRFRMLADMAGMCRDAALDTRVLDILAQQGHQGVLVQRMQTLGAWMRSPWSWVPQGSLQTLGEILLQRHRDIQAHYSSTAGRAELHALLRKRQGMLGTGTSPVLVGRLPGGNNRGGEVALLNGVFLGHGHAGHPHVGVMPQWVGDHITQELRQPYSGELYPLQGPFLLTDTDTSGVLETAVALWTPGGNGDLSDLGAALEAARALHATGD